MSQGENLKKNRFSPIFSTQVSIHAPRMCWDKKMTSRSDDFHDNDENACNHDSSCRWRKTPDQRGDSGTAAVTLCPGTLKRHQTSELPFLPARKTNRDSPLVQGIGKKIQTKRLKRGKTAQIIRNCFYLRSLSFFRIDSTMDLACLLMTFSPLTQQAKTHFFPLLSTKPTNNPRVKIPRASVPEPVFP